MANEVLGPFPLPLGVLQAEVRRSEKGTGAPAPAYHELQRKVKEALTCPTCKKSRTVLNLAGAGQRFVGELVSCKTHCSCPGGPAAFAACHAPDAIDADGTCVDCGFRNDVTVRLAQRKAELARERESGGARG